MNQSRLALLILLITSSACFAQREATIKMLPELHLLEPAWTSPVVHRESSVVLQKDDQSPKIARLAFPATEVLNIRSATGEKTYVIGKDVQLSENGLTLIFPANSSVASIKEQDLFPAEGSPMSYRHRVGNPKQNLLYGPGRWFHDRQIEVTYRTKRTAETKPIVQFAESALPKTLAILNAGKPLTLGISGDSISAGGDASLLAKAPPMMPAFPELVSAQLQASYRSEITLKNRAVGGWSIANGNADLDKLLAEKPQLIIVGYGMNDVGRRDPKWFKDQTQQLVQRIQKADKDIEIILVSPMLGHNEWVHTPREMFSQYRDALQTLTGPGIVLADVSSVWELLLKNKHDLDLTGNGLNHPNDFGHRLYAQTILGLLIQRK